MKKLLCLLLLLLPIGCASKGASCGWRFEMGKPGELNMTYPYTQSSGQLGIAPVGAIGLDSRVAVMGASRVAVGEEYEQLPAASLLRPSSARKVVSPPSDCTMEEICALLRALAAKQGIQSRGMDVKPMPKE